MTPDALPLRDPVAVFTAVLLVLLAAPLVARRGVPASVVLLVAGVALGPNALGVLDRDPTMVLLGTVGLLYIMFLAGLEIDLHEFARHRRHSLVFGGLTFALPQLTGTAVGRLGLGLDWPAAVLLGSVFASHTLLAYPAAARLGLSKETAVTTAVGATILTDTLALLVLAVVATGARTGGGADAWVLVRVAGSLVAFGALVLWGVPRLGAWFLRRAAQDATVEFVFVLATVFACALAVEGLGIEPIIGAFLAGLALNRLVPEGGALANRIGFFGNAMFVPFFLLSTGMLVDLGAFRGGPDVGASWAVAGTMVAVILVTKGAAAWATRPAFGYSAAQVRLVYGLTVPQAAATLAAVLVGVEVGLFGPAVLNGAIAMVLVTCLVGPWLVETAGRQIAAGAAARAPASPARSRLLVSLSNPATVGDLVDLALLARADGASAPLAAVTVVGGGPDRDHDVAAGERLLSTAVVHAAGAAVPVLPLVRTETNVARALARAAAETRATTVVMGWDGSAAAERVLFGSVPDRVMSETAAAVLIAHRTGALPTARRLVVAVPALAAREPGFAAGARLLARLAARVGAELAVLAPAAPGAEGPDAGGADPLAAFASGAATRLRLPDWGDLDRALSDTLRSTDALAVVSARRGSVAWSASLDRLPRTLADRFPGLPLLVLYPGQGSAAAVLPVELTGGERRLLSRFGADHVRLDLRAGTAAEVAGDVTAGLLDAPDRDALVAAVGAGAVVEVRPGVGLVHARTDAAGGSLLAVGVSRGGVPGATGPLYVVAVLAAPAAVPSATYLRWLALVARMLRQDETVEAVRQAETPGEARAALLEALQEPAETVAAETVAEPA